MNDTRQVMADCPELIVAEALESDCCYFDLAARTERLDGATLVWMPGLESLSAASVVQRINPSESPDTLIGRAGHACRIRGINILRLYLQEDLPLWSDRLPALGLSVREEQVMIAGREQIRAWSGLPPVVVESVRDLADWEARYQLLATGGHAPDGYNVNARQYVEMEKQKSSTGKLDFYLVREAPGAPVIASVGVMASANQTRLKNLVVHPEFRRQGLASRTIAQIARTMITPGGWLSAFAVGHPGRKSFYERMGFIHAASCYEWRESRDGLSGAS